MAEQTLYLIISIFLCLAAGTLFFMSRRTEIRQRGATGFFQAACISFIVWQVFTSLLFVMRDAVLAHNIAMVRYVGVAFFPSLLMLHIWRQFSMGLIRKGRLLLCVLPPTIASLMALTNEWTRIFIVSIGVPDPTRPFYFFPNYNWGFYVHCSFSYLASITGVVLLLRTFFQVPRHMRKTINIMSAAALVTVATNVTVLFVGIKFVYDITALGSLVTLYLFYLALHVTRSANIVITSRGYVWAHLSSMILVLDENNLILDFNNTEASEKLGLAPPQVMEPYEEFKERWILSGNGRVSKYDPNIITFTKLADESHFRIRMNAVVENGKNYGYFVEISEITEVYTLLRYLEESSLYDYLTGLFNRNAYIAMAPDYCKPEKLPLLVIIGDVNGLKAVNDEKGHFAGDKLLQTLARIFAECAPARSFIARMGGDEFILLIPGESEAYGTQLIRDIQERCRQTYVPEFGYPSVSLGAAVVSTGGKDLREAIETADREMYMAKRGAGRPDAATRHRYITG